MTRDYDTLLENRAVAAAVARAAATAIITMSHVLNPVWQRHESA